MFEVSEVQRVLVLKQRERERRRSIRISALKRNWIRLKLNSNSECGLFEQFKVVNLIKSHLY